jgi:hypothetical protein
MHKFTNDIWEKGIQVYSDKGPGPLLKGDVKKKNGLGVI